VNPVHVREIGRAGRHSGKRLVGSRFSRLGLQQAGEVSGLLLMVGVWTWNARR